MTTHYDAKICAKKKQTLLLSTERVKGLGTCAPEENKVTTPGR